MWNSDDIPKIWKETTVIPILKPFKDNTNVKKNPDLLLLPVVSAKH